MWGWLPVIDLSARNGFVTLMKLQMETVAAVLRSVRTRNLGCIFGFVSRDVSTSSVPCVSVCPRPHKCSAESLL